MLTRRGFWLAGFALVVTGPSILFGAQNAVLLGLAVLLWFGCLWIKFAIEASFLLSRLQLTRTVGGQSCERASLTVGRTAAIQATLTNPVAYELGLLKIEDRVPSNVLLLEGTRRVTASCQAGRPLRLEYNVMATTAGRRRFDGLRIELIDRYGFFRHRSFLRQPEEISVLPPVALEQDAAPSLKRRNILPTQGIHRYKRPGSGTELLDLRDYIAGDPPKSIAWKVSARRDRLITKEYESEVPVRCTIYFDASDSMKIGPPDQAPAAQAANIAASLAQQLIAHRDPVGLCVFDGEGSLVLAPAAHGRHLMRIRHMLAEAISRPVSPKPSSPASAFDAAFRLAEDVYPDLMDASGRWPGSWFKRASLSDLGWPVYATAIAGILLLAFIGMVAPPSELRLPLISAAVFGVGLATVMFWSQRQSRRQGGLVTRTYARKKRLASVLAAWSGGDAGTAARLLADEPYLSVLCQEFCHAHAVQIPLQLYSAEGEYLYKQPEKLQVLAKRLLNAAARGKDNELFVLCVDLLEIVDEAKKFLTAVKVVQARHHQVIVICPWPSGLAFPDSPQWLRLASYELDPRHVRFRDPQTTLYAYEFARYRNAYEHLKAQLKTARVPLICTTTDDTVRQVLDRVELLRSGRVHITARYKQPST